MPVQERDYLKSGQAPATSKTPAWLARLNEIGERHATAIITVSTGLIILIVLLFAKGAYDRTEARRADTELARAQTVEALRGVKTKYGSTPAAPLISYRLAGALYDDGKLAESLAEYQEFRRRWPGHPLSDRVAVAVETIERNIRYADERKTLLAKQSQLQSHPRQLPDAKDPRLQYGPVREANPVVEMALPAGAVKIELLAYEAAQAVDQVADLVKKNAFEGQKWDVVGEAERLQLQAPVTAAPAYEAGPRAVEAGAVALVKGEPTPRLQVFLKPAAELKDAVVVGRVTEGLDRLASVKKDESVPPLKLAGR